MKLNNWPDQISVLKDCGGYKAESLSGLTRIAEDG